MYLCFFTSGGVGVSTVAAALALRRSNDAPTLLVDLRGDQPALLGLSDEPRPGLGEWLVAGDDVGTDALRQLEVQVAQGLSLLPAGSGPQQSASRTAALVHALSGSSRAVVVDAGTTRGELWRQLGAVAADRILVTKACYLGLRRLRECDIEPTAVVLFREAGRALAPALVREHVAAPIVGTMAYDPAVSRAVDAGLITRRLPRTLRSAVRRLGA